MGHSISPNSHSLRQQKRNHARLQHRASTMLSLIPFPFGSEIHGLLPWAERVRWVRRCPLEPKPGGLEVLRGFPRVRSVRTRVQFQIQTTDANQQTKGSQVWVRPVLGDQHGFPLRDQCKPPTKGHLIMKELIILTAGQRRQMPADAGKTKHIDDQEQNEMMGQEKENTEISGRGDRKAIMQGCDYIPVSVGAPLRVTDLSESW